MSRGKDRWTEWTPPSGPAVDGSVHEVQLIQKNIFTQLPRVAPIQADSFGFVCAGFEKFASEISVCIGRPFH